MDKKLYLKILDTVPCVQNRNLEERRLAPGRYSIPRSLGY